MDVFGHIGRNYDWYPNTAIALCAIDYDDLGQIAVAVKDQTGLDVVWGPAELKHRDGISYSLAYIAGDAASGEYFVAIRGTNFDSLSSWMQQDFAISTAQAFADLPGKPPGVPTDALISQGTFNGLSDLIRLVDHSSGQGMVAFLQKLKPRYLYVTGHSLGGTLSAPTFAYLNAMLYGPGPVSNMALWSFAGLTAGGTGFNRYFNSILQNAQGFLWRLRNSLDIAPHCWDDSAAIEHIYRPHRLQWDFVEKDLVHRLFSEAAQAGIGYAHPQSGLLLPGVFDDGIVDRNIWAAQALQQHHPATYRALVKTQYPNPRR